MDPDFNEHEITPRLFEAGWLVRPGSDFVSGEASGTRVTAARMSVSDDPRFSDALARVQGKCRDDVSLHDTKVSAEKRPIDAFGLIDVIRRADAAMGPNDDLLATPVPTTFVVYEPLLSIDCVGTQLAARRVRS